MVTLLVRIKTITGTKIVKSPENQDQLRKNLEEFGKNPNLVPFYNVLVRGENGDVYYCPETERCIATQNHPSTGKRTLIKAQPLSAVQLERLQSQRRLDD